MLHNSHITAMWPPLAWFCTPRVTCAPKVGMGWNIFLDSNLFQGRSYPHESLSNPICTSHAIAAQFSFNHSWWWTHLSYFHKESKPFFMHHCSCKRLIAFSILEVWFGNGWHGWDWETRQRNYISLLWTIFFFLKKVKLLQSKSSGRQASYMSFKSNFGDAA